MTDPTPDEIARLRRIIEAQDQALAHWRREADRDAGTLKRFNQALTDIAFTVCNDLESLKARARRALEGTVCPDR